MRCLTETLGGYAEGSQRLDRFSAVRTGVWQMAPQSQSAIWEMVVCKSVCRVGVQARAGQGMSRSLMSQPIPASGARGGEPVGLGPAPLQW